MLGRTADAVPVSPRLSAGSGAPQCERAEPDARHSITSVDTSTDVAERARLQTPPAQNARNYYECSAYQSTISCPLAFHTPPYRLMCASAWSRYLIRQGCPMIHGWMLMTITLPVVAPST